MSPRAFINLKAIKYVTLNSNECINKAFSCPEEQKELLQELSAFCSSKDQNCQSDNAKIELNSKCAKADSISDRIMFGTEAFPAQWPFLATLHYDSTQSFFCGAVLITAKHVVTAAHCVYKKHDDEKLNPADVFVFVGRHNISLKAERGSKTRWVKEIIVHQDWSSTSEKYGADIAILELDEIVRFSESIKPVCVDNFSSNALSNNGKVVSCDQAGQNHGN